MGVGQFVLIEPQLMQDRGVHVAEMIGSFHGPQSDGVRGPHDLTASNATSGHPHGKAKVVVISASAGLRLGRSPEFASPEDQGRIQEPPPFEILQ